MQSVQDISTHHTISAQDVPGTLLNMALLNLGKLLNANPF